MLHFLCSCSYLFKFLLASQFYWHYWHIRSKLTVYFLTHPVEYEKHSGDRPDAAGSAAVAAGASVTAEWSTTQHSLTCYLLLEVDGLCSCQLWMPISCQCRSSLFLDVLIDGASTTSCGSFFHSLTIRKLKKFCLTVVWHLGLNNFNECPLSPLVTSASSKNLLWFHVLFQSVSWMFLLNLHVVFVFLGNRYPTSSTWSHMVASRVLWPF